jgi:hypothetical protein
LIISERAKSFLNARMQLCASQLVGGGLIGPARKP